MLFNIDTIHEGSRYRIKDQEKAKVFQSLCISEANTRKAIAHSLKLRPITVSKVIQELVEDRLVFEGKAKGRSSKGRPEIRLVPSYHRLSSIAVYVLSREIKGALVSLNEEILKTQSILIPEDADNAYIEGKIRSIVVFLTGKLPEGSQLIGIVTSLPGTVNAGQDNWISSARWPQLDNLCLTSLAVEFGIPLVMRRGLDPELEFLLVKNPQYRQGGTLLFHWGYGIGSAFALDGKVLKSSLGRFGEVGHWQVSPTSSKQCNCGFKGCLETEAALWAILEEIKEVYPDAPEDEPEFTDFIRNINLVNLGVVKKALGFIIPALTNLYKTFYPDRILLFGPFTENESIAAMLKNGFTEMVPEYARQSVELKVVSGFQGAVLGSLYPLFKEALRPLLKTRANV